MPEKLNDEQVVVGEDLENKQPDTEGVAIPLDESGDVASAEAIKAQQEEEKKQADEQRKRNAEHAQRRIDQEKVRLKQQLEESTRRIAELEKKQSLGFRDNTQPQTKDKSYWEQRLAADPVGALDEYEDFKYNQRLQKQMESQERESMIESFNTTLQESQDMALEEFPQLNDETSPEYTTFMDILSKNPAWRKSPIGPMKVIKEMKKMMSSNDAGVISKIESRGAQAEQIRQARIVNQPLSGGRSSEKPKSVTLSRDQLQYCKDNNIKPEDYAQMQLKLSRGEGVSV